MRHGLYCLIEGYELQSNEECYLAVWVETAMALTGKGVL